MCRDWVVGAQRPSFGMGSPPRVSSPSRPILSLLEVLRPTAPRKPTHGLPYRCRPDGQRQPMGSTSASSRCSSGPGVLRQVQLPLGLAYISVRTCRSRAAHTRSDAWIPARRPGSSRCSPSAPTHALPGSDRPIRRARSSCGTSRGRSASPERPGTARPSRRRPPHAVDD